VYYHELSRDPKSKIVMLVAPILICDWRPLVRPLRCHGKEMASNHQIWLACQVRGQ